MKKSFDAIVTIDTDTLNLMAECRRWKMFVDTQDEPSLMIGDHVRVTVEVMKQELINEFTGRAIIFQDDSKEHREDGVIVSEGLYKMQLIDWSRKLEVGDDVTVRVYSYK